MKFNSVFKAIAFSFFVIGVAGCEKAPQSINKGPRPAVISNEKQEMGVDNKEAPTTKELLAYYSANLKEAKEKWDECKKRLDKVSDKEKPHCVAAGNAWHNQPYKAGR